jgi:hypothetical protein
MRQHCEREVSGRLVKKLYDSVAILGNLTEYAG